MGAILMSFLNLCLTIAIIILIVMVILWVVKWMGVSIDPDVYKWGRIVVGLLILIAIVGWLLGVLGFAHISAFPIMRW
jgi:hypothetical protein